MLLADRHPNLPRSLVAHHARQPRRPIPRAAAHEANAIRIVPVILLVAVGIQVAGEDQVGQLAAARRGFFVRFCQAVQVAVEGAGVAFFAQEDEAVGEGLEEAFDAGGHCLAGLGVVVGDDCDGGDGLFLDEGVVEDSAEVGFFGGGELGEVVEKRGVVEGEFVVELVEPVGHDADVAGPELAGARVSVLFMGWFAGGGIQGCLPDHEDIVAAFLAHLVDPLVGKALAEMLHGV